MNDSDLRTIVNRVHELDLTNYDDIEFSILYEYGKIEPELIVNIFDNKDRICSWVTIHNIAYTDNAEQIENFIRSYVACLRKFHICAN